MAVKPEQTGGGSGGSSITPNQSAGSNQVSISQDLYDYLLSQAAVAGTSQTNQTSNPPSRWATDPRFGPTATGVFTGAAPTPSLTPGAIALGGRPANTYMYNGPGLVDSTGRVLTRTNENGEEEPYLYSPVQDGYNAYVTASPEQREMVADTLREAGFTMDTIDDYVNGYAYLFEQANLAGLSFDRLYTQFKMYAPKVQAKGSSPTYRVTNADDIKAVAKSVAYQTLGRNFTDDEANRFVETYQQMELSTQQRAAGGGVVEAAPDIGVAAEGFAQQAAPKEADAYKYLGHVNALFNSLGAI